MNQERSTPKPSIEAQSHAFEVARNHFVVAAVVAAVAWGLAPGGAVAGTVPAVWWCALLAFAVQWAVFVPSFLAQTEHYYDLTGSLTYLATTGLALFLVGSYDPRSLLIASLVAVWAGRLGLFLFRRVRRAGKDGRFDKLKVSLPLFLQTWTLQGLWVFLTLAAGLAALTAPAPDQALGWWEAAGLAVWILGWGLEVIADHEKNVFRADPKNDGNFIATGLWSWSRHPNYFGEITLWVGIALIATPTLEGWRWVAWISPLFVTVLLTTISGLPMLERRADKKWGGQQEYELYKQRTAILVPRPPRRS